MRAADRRGRPSVAADRWIGHNSPSTYESAITRRRTARPERKPVVVGIEWLLCSGPRNNPSRIGCIDRADGG